MGKNFRKCGSEYSLILTILGLAESAHLSAFCSHISDKLRELIGEDICLTRHLSSCNRNKCIDVVRTEFVLDAEARSSHHRESFPLMDAKAGKTPEMRVGINMHHEK